MKITFALFGMLMLSACNSGITKHKTEQQEKFLNIPESELILIQSQGIFFYKNKPFTGSSIKKYSNLQTSRSIEYVKGKKQGQLKMWFEEGQISYLANYKNGKLDGAIQSWWRNGQKRSESNYKNGKVHGTQKQWYLNGEKFKELNFTNGLEEGMQTAWRENGKIYNNYEAKNGRIFGLKRANLCYSLDDETIQYRN